MCGTFWGLQECRMHGLDNDIDEVYLEDLAKKTEKNGCLNIHKLTDCWCCMDSME